MGVLANATLGANVGVREEAGAGAGAVLRWPSISPRLPSRPPVFLVLCSPLFLMLQPATKRAESGSREILENNWFL